MTEAEALQNTFAAIQGLRTLKQGAPREIALIDDDKVWTLVHFGYWSKSSINNGAQVLFLVLQNDLSDEQIEASHTIQHGNELWKITERKSPADLKKAYWQLFVTFGGTDGN